MKNLTWKKSNVNPMFPNTAGSSDDKTTGMPWFSSTGSGCIGIDEVSRFGIRDSEAWRNQGP